MTYSGLHVKRIRRYLFDRSFRLFARAQSVSAYQRRAKKNCRIIRNVPYLQSQIPSHQLDIYCPHRASSPRPVIMYIHGGGFTMCSKETHQGVGLAYADHGYVVFNVNYRYAPRYRYPAALEDISHAWRWIVENANRFGGDPQQIIVAGESAGGNLTLALAVAACFPVDDPAADRVRRISAIPKGIMVMCGMLQVSVPGRLHNVCPPINRLARKINLSIAADVSRAYLGATYKAPQSNRILADPLLVLESDTLPVHPFPVTYAMAGTHDILCDDTRRLEHALIKRHLLHQVEYFPQQGHAFHLLGFGDSAKRFWQENLMFLSRLIS